MGMDTVVCSDGEAAVRVEELIHAEVWLPEEHECYLLADAEQRILTQLQEHVPIRNAGGRKWPGSRRRLGRQGGRLAACIVDRVRRTVDATGLFHCEDGLRGNRSLRYFEDA
jgi:hypothetical protein